MKEVLKTYIIEKFGYEPLNLDTVIDLFEPFKFNRKEFLVFNGDVCKHCYFIVEGCVQVFGYDKSGNETTRDFVFDQNWVMEIESFSKQQPAKENLRAVETTTALGISATNFQKMLKEVPPFEIMYRQIIELSYVNSVFRLNTFIGMEAAERVKWMYEHQPKLLQKLSNKMVASYLGISPETLSRLKANL
ncbi:MAG: Crp/Fnr family transcriptional regulator [Saprospiraceae bacterium]|nr:Crp/Fnr family transcriptional regulator [Saprospiraceae bacterium]